MMRLDHRAPRLRRLARYLHRGMPLVEALEVLGEDLPRGARRPWTAAVARAREGAALPAALAGSGLIDPQGEALLAAWPQDDAVTAIKLLADDAEQQRELWQAWCDEIRAPVLRLSAVLALGFVMLFALATPIDMAADSMFLRLTVLILLACGLTAVLVAVWVHQVAPLRDRIEALLLHALLMRPHRRQLAVATWLTALGHGLAHGEAVPAALRRARLALGDDGLLGDRVGELESLADEGATLELCCEHATWLPASLRLIVAENAQRAELPRDLVELAGQERARVRLDLLAQGPTWRMTADLAAALPVLTYVAFGLIALDRLF